MVVTICSALSCRYVRRGKHTEATSAAQLEGACVGSISPQTLRMATSERVPVESLQDWGHA